MYALGTQISWLKSLQVSLGCCCLGHRRVLSFESDWSAIGLSHGAMSVVIWMQLRAMMKSLWRKFFENLNLFVLCLFCFAVLCYEFALGMMVNVDGSCIILSAHSPNPSNPSPRFCRNIHSLKNKNQKTKEKSTEKERTRRKDKKSKGHTFRGRRNIWWH